MSTDSTNQGAGIILPTNQCLLARNGGLQLKYEFNEQGSVFLLANSDEPYVRIPKVGEVIEPGWKYGGVSATTGSPLFVSITDEPMTKSWDRAVNEASMLENYFGHNGSQQKTEDLLLNAMKNDTRDFGVRLPTADELFVNIRAQKYLIGKFNLVGPDYSDWYWSSTFNQETLSARTSNFNMHHEKDNNPHYWDLMCTLRSVRLVRG